MPTRNPQGVAAGLSELDSRSRYRLQPRSTIVGLDYRVAATRHGQGVENSPVASKSRVPKRMLGVRYPVRMFH